MARPKVYDARLRDRLIAGAAAVLAQSGPAALSLRPLAAQAGTSTSAVYAMFGSRSALVAEVVAEARRSFAAAQRESATSEDPAADLIALGHAYRDWALAHPALYAVMFGGRLQSDCPESSELAALGDEAMAPLVTLVRRLAQVERLVTGDVDLAAWGIWSGVHGLVSLEIAGLIPLSTEAITTSFGLALEAIQRGWLV